MDVESLIKADDATFIKEISKLPGVGEWTVQMLLIHVLKRPNVISYKDLAVLRGMRMVYQMSDLSREFFVQKKAFIHPMQQRPVFTFGRFQLEKLYKTCLERSRSCLSI